MSEIKWPVGEPIIMKNPKVFHWLIGLGFIWSILLILGGVFILIQLGYSDDSIPNNICDERVENATNVGLEYAIASLTSEAIRCNPIPITYANYSYTLVAIECLNLNQSGGIK